MTHPTFDDCCTPWVRTKPSGRPEYVHRFNCAVAPNRPLDRKPVPRAEIASHAVRDEPDRDEYEMEWRDLAYELEGGR